MKQHALKPEDFKPGGALAHVHEAIQAAAVKAVSWMLAFDEGFTAHNSGKGYFDNPYMDVQGKQTEMRRWVDGKVAAIIAEREAV